MVERITFSEGPAEIGHTKPGRSCCHTSCVGIGSIAVESGAPRMAFHNTELTNTSPDAPSDRVGVSPDRVVTLLGSLEHMV